MRETTAQLQDARTRVLGWRLDADGFAAIEKGVVADLPARAQGAGRQLRDPTPERFHEWRKRVKYHWYHLRLLRELWPAPMKALAAEAKQLADLLGDDHDLAVLRETLVHERDDLGDQEEIDALLALAQRRQDQLRAQARHAAGVCLPRHRPTSAVACRQAGMQRNARLPVMRAWSARAGWTAEPLNRVSIPLKKYQCRSWLQQAALARVTLPPLSGYF